MTASRRRRYKSPPLQEALVEFHFAPHGPWDTTIPGLLFDRVRDTFPIKRTRGINEVQLEIRDQQVEHTLTKSERSQFFRKDESAIVQVGPNFLAANHLPPYLEWEQLRDIALKALTQYMELDHPKSIDRMAIQYLNRIEFPGGKVDLEDYFEFYPRVTDDLAESYGAFFVGLHIPHEAQGASLAVELTPAKPTSETERAGIMLTLTFQTLKPFAPDLERISSWLEAGHVAINNAFEASITDKLRSKFTEG